MQQTSRCVTICFPILTILFAKQWYALVPKCMKSFFNSLAFHPETSSPSKFNFPRLNSSACLIPTVKYKEVVLEMSVAQFKFKKIVKQSLTEMLIGFHAFVRLWGKKG